MSKILKHCLYYFFNLLFPITCIVCDAEGRDICDECVSRLHPAKRPNEDWILSMGNYHDDAMRKIMWHIKKMPDHRTATIIARMFSENILNRPQEPDLWIFVPIPIARKRFRERGYNQSELLADALSAEFNLAIEKNVLIKTRHTIKQGTSRSKQERMTNLIGSFGICNQEKIKDKNIILVDDITTTGSTLIEARNTLLNSGARSVTAWTVAN